MNSDFFLNIFTHELFNRICWKIHNKYVFHVNIHIFVLKYLVPKQIIQNQFKISEGGKWNSHQMPCVNNYRICPIKIEITLKLYTLFLLIKPNGGHYSICFSLPIANMNLGKLMLRSEIGNHAPRGNYTLLYDGEGEIDFRLAKIHTIYNGKGI